MTEDQKGIQQACIEWMVQHKDAFTYAVTLTLKSYRRLENDRGQAVEQLTHLEAKRTFGYFKKRLNIALFGKAAKRYDRSFSVIPVLEGQGTNKRLHYHCAIGNLPAGLTIESFKAKVQEAWSNTPFGYDEIDVKPIDSADWFAYMGKEIGIKNADVLDWENVVIPSAPTSLV